MFINFFETSRGQQLFERIDNQIESFNSSYLLKYQILKSEYFKLTKQYSHTTSQSSSFIDEELTRSFYLLTNDQKAKSGDEFQVVKGIVDTFEKVLGFSISIDLVSQLEDIVKFNASLKDAQIYQEEYRQSRITILKEKNEFDSQAVRLKRIENFKNICSTLKIKNVNDPLIEKELYLEVYDNLLKDSLIASSFFPLIRTFFGKDVRFGLIYCGTTHGFASNVFHNCCDNKGSTITFIRSSNGFIAGGYSACFMGFLWEL
jgi:hypothetical protein